MINLEFDPLFWTRCLLAAALIVQTVELLSIRHTFDENGVWRWADIRLELLALPKLLRLVFDAVLSYRPFVFLLWLELVVAAALIFTMSSLVVGYLLFMSIAIAVRWRGTFNGGSDYMTVVILTGLFAASLYPNNPDVALGALYYIAVVSCLSYFIAGVTKLRSPGWRDGSALITFLRSGTFEVSKIIEEWMQPRRLGLTASWIIVSYECLFPLAILDHIISALFLVSGIGFHLLNAYFLGLNRFFFVWLATYPAIYWCSQTQLS